MAEHRTPDELNAGLEYVRQSPADIGVLRAIVIRPRENERQLLDLCDLSPELGAHGDNWANGYGLRTDNRRPHPHTQIAIMNARAIELVAGEPERWQLAGDNLFVDLDLSVQNLPCGQRLLIGDAVLEITPRAHNGCQKFAARFGQDALHFVNSPVGKQLHLRGIYARVVQAGHVHVGDAVKKA